MDIQRLKSFFLWCTILDGAILLLWTVVWTFAPDWLFGVQSRWFPLPKEAFMVAMYAFVGMFKILFLIFNVVPLIALAIIGRK